MIRTYIRKNISVLVLTAFLINSFGPLPSHAQIDLPLPGVMIEPTAAFSPALVKGLVIDMNHPMQMDFLIDPSQTSAGNKQEEYRKLAQYFLAALTVPEKDLWVNLSPYERNHMVPQEFGKTQMGRDLLAQDYILKQLTASLIYPEKELGKQFWQKIYKQAQEQLGTTNIPVNTFNKVWIVPDKAVVYEKQGKQNITAFLVESHLKVMLEEDYLSKSKNADASSNQIGPQIIRDIVLPAIEQEVNEGKNFANLRQINNALILATWYKKRLKESILGKLYVDQNKTTGVNQEDIKDNQRIYDQYLKAFKKGVYNYIKEEPDPVTNQMTPRKYFSGGYSTVVDKASLAERIQITDTFSDTAMKGLLQISLDRAQISLENGAIPDQVTSNVKLVYQPVTHNLNHSSVAEKWADKIIKEMKNQRAHTNDYSEKDLWVQTKYYLTYIVGALAIGTSPMLNNWRHEIDGIPKSDEDFAYIGRRMDDFWQSQGFGNFFARSALLDNYFIRDLHAFKVVRQRLVAISGKANIQDKAKALWVRGVQQSLHLRRFFPHPEQDNLIHKTELVDNENLVKDVREFITLLISWQTQDPQGWNQLVSVQQGYQGEPLGITNGQLMLWGLLVMLDPWNHNIDNAIDQKLFGISFDENLAKLKNQEAWAQNGETSIPYFMERMLAPFDGLNDQQVQDLLLQAIKLAKGNQYMISPFVVNFSDDFDSMYSNRLTDPETIGSIDPIFYATLKESNKFLTSLSLEERVQHYRDAFQQGNLFARFPLIAKTLEKITEGGEKTRGETTTNQAMLGVDFTLKGGAGLVTPASSDEMTRVRQSAETFDMIPSSNSVGYEIQEGLKWNITDTSLETIDEKYKVIKKIVQLDEAREDKSKPLVILDWGAGEGSALVELRARLDQLGIPNVILIGYSNQFYSQWEKAPAGVVFIYSPADKLAEQFKKINIKNIDLIYTENGIEHFLRYSSPSITYPHIRYLLSLLSPQGDFRMGDMLSFQEELSLKNNGIGIAYEIGYESLKLSQKPTAVEDVKDKAMMTDIDKDTWVSILKNAMDQDRGDFDSFWKQIEALLEQVMGIYEYDMDTIDEEDVLALDDPNPSQKASKLKIIQEMGNELREYWREKGLDKKYGPLNQYLARLNRHYEEDPNRFRVVQQRLDYLTMGGSLEDQSIALWTRAIQEIFHLRYEGPHGLLKEGSFWDNDNLKDVVRKFIPTLIVMQQKGMQPSLRLNPDYKSSAPLPFTYRDFMLWGLVMMLDPLIHDYLLDPQHFKEETWALGKSKWPQGPKQAMSEYLQGMLTDLEYVDEQGVKQKVSNEQVEDLLVEAFSILPEMWEKKGLRSPYEAYIRSGNKMHPDVLFNGRAAPEMADSFPLADRMFVFAYDKQFHETNPEKDWSQRYFSLNKSQYVQGMIPFALLMEEPFKSQFPRVAELWRQRDELGILRKAFNELMNPPQRVSHGDIDQADEAMVAKNNLMQTIEVKNIIKEVDSFIKTNASLSPYQVTDSSIKMLVGRFYFVFSDIAQDKKEYGILITKQLREEAQKFKGVKNVVLQKLADYIDGLSLVKGNEQNPKTLPNPSDFVAMLGPNLKKLREEKGKTIQEAADDIGISYPTLQKTESNAQENVYLPQMIKMANYYGRTIHSLITGEKDTQPFVPYDIDLIEQTLGDNLRSARKTRGLNIDQMNISDGTYQGIESGRIEGFFTVRSLIVVAKQLRVPLEQLLRINVHINFDVQQANDQEQILFLMNNAESSHLYKDIGRRIGEQLELRGETNESFAKRVNLDDTTLHFIIKGERTDLQALNVSNIAQKLGVSVFFLMTGKNTERQFVYSKNIEKELKDNVSKLREFRGIKQKVASRRAGMTEIHFYLIEKGKLVPKLNSLISMARVLRVPVDLFFADPKEVDAYISQQAKPIDEDLQWKFIVVDDKYVADSIWMARESRITKLETVLEKTGFTEDELLKIEDGLIQKIPLETIYKIANAHQISIFELITGHPVVLKTGEAWGDYDYLETETYFHTNLKQVKGTMSDVEFSQKVGINLETLRDINEGEMPDLGTILKIAKAFHVPIDHLLKGNDHNLQEDFLLAVKDILKNQSDKQSQFNNVKNIIIQALIEHKPVSKVLADVDTKVSLKQDMQAQANRLLAEFAQHNIIEKIARDTYRFSPWKYQVVVGQKTNNLEGKNVAGELVETQKDKAMTVVNVPSTELVNGKEFLKNQSEFEEQANRLNNRIDAYLLGHENLKAEDVTDEVIKEIAGGFYFTVGNLDPNRRKNGTTITKKLRELAEGEVGVKQLVLLRMATYINDVVIDLTKPFDDKAYYSNLDFTKASEHASLLRESGKGAKSTADEMGISRGAFENIEQGKGLVNSWVAFLNYHQRTLEDLLRGQEHSGIFSPYTLNNFEDILAKNIKSAREAKGYTQRQMADLLGITQANYIRYEQGQMPKPSFLITIGSVLGVSLEQLLRENVTLAYAQDIVDESAQFFYLPDKVNLVELMERVDTIVSSQGGSLKQLAREIGMSNGFIYPQANGEKEDMYLEGLIKVAKHLKVSIYELITGKKTRDERYLNYNWDLIEARLGDNIRLACSMLGITIDELTQSDQLENMHLHRIKTPSVQRLNAIAKRLRIPVDVLLTYNEDQISAYLANMLKPMRLADESKNLIDDLSIIGQNIANMRIAQHMSIDSLAQSIQISPEDLLAIENGVEGKLTIKILIALANALKISVFKLLSGFSNQDDVNKSKTFVPYDYEKIRNYIPYNLKQIQNGIFDQIMAEKLGVSLIEYLKIKFQGTEDVKLFIRLIKGTEATVDVFLRGKFDLKEASIESIGDYLDKFLGEDPQITKIDGILDELLLQKKAMTINKGSRIDKILDHMHQLHILKRDAKDNIRMTPWLSELRMGDQAMSATKQNNPGGIDLNPSKLDLQIKRDSEGVLLPLSEQPILNLRIEGLTPVIINITHVSNLPELLGVSL